MGARNLAMPENSKSAAYVTWVPPAPAGAKVIVSLAFTVLLTPCRAMTLPSTRSTTV
jgi:hypothetical protein